MFILDGKSDAIKGDYEKFATENKGIFRIGSVDCDDFTAICDKEGLKSFPAIRIYPTFPVPTQDVEIGDKFELSKLKKAGSRFYSDHSIEITSNNHKTFIEEDIATPKVLLFTNSKKGTPFVYKALSSNLAVSLYHCIDSHFYLIENHAIRAY